MADTCNLVVYRGQKANVQFVRSSGTTSAAGKTLAFTVRKDDSDTGVIFQKTGAAITVNGGGDTITVAVTAADNTLSPGAYRCDLWITDAGSEDLLAEGVYTVRRNPRVKYP